MAFDFSTLITDRSPEDLQVLRDLLATPMADWTEEQNAEFLRARSKGAYNYTDLNRVTACMDYLNEVLTGLGYVTGYQRIVVPHKEPGSISPLPKGYTELEYIESTGTQYINTGVSAKSTSGFYIKFSVLSTSGTTGIIGGFTYGGYNNNFAAMNGHWGVQYGSNATYQFGSVDTAVHEVSQNIEGGIVVFDGSTIQTGLVFYDNTERTFNLFCYNGGPSYPTFWIGPSRIYSCKMYDNGVLIRDYIPSINPSGVIGLYDLVSRQFFENAGAGSFTTGPEVHPEPDLDIYTWYESDIPTQSQMVQYLTNVTALKNAISLAEDTPAVPLDMDGLTVQEANNIEEILDVIDRYLLSLQRVFLRSGMSWAVSGGPGFYFAN